MSAKIRLIVVTVLLQAAWVLAGACPSECQEHDEDQTPIKWFSVDPMAAPGEVEDLPTVTNPVVFVGRIARFGEVELPGISGHLEKV
jgi:hypothetical protein